MAFVDGIMVTVTVCNRRDFLRSTPLPLPLPPPPVLVIRSPGAALYLTYVGASAGVVFRGGGGGGGGGGRAVRRGNGIELKVTDAAVSLPRLL